MKLTAEEAGIALKVFPKQRDTVVYEVLKGSHDQGRQVTITDSVAADLRKDLEHGLSTGTFSGQDADDARAMYRKHFVVGWPMTSPAMDNGSTVPKRYRRR